MQDSLLLILLLVVGSSLHMISMVADYHLRQTMTQHNHAPMDSDSIVGEHSTVKVESHGLEVYGA